MITFLHGTIAEKHPTRIVLDVGGIGYEVFIPLGSYDRLPEKNHECCVLTVDYVREDQHLLFGFMTEEERDVFLKLLSVSGIGPKLALSALSGLSVREVTASIVAGDIGMLSSISGVGKKIAERMVVELRDKFAEADTLAAASKLPEQAGYNQRARDAVMALISLGYKQMEAKKMITAIIQPDGEEISVEELVRKALTR